MTDSAAPSIIVQLFSQYQDYPPLWVVLELVAAAFGLISVWLARCGSVWVFPVGLISTGLYVYLLWQWQLFGDMLINAYYSIMAIYGFFNWRHHKNNNSVQISNITPQDFIKLSLIAVFTFLFVGVIYYLKPVFDTSNTTSPSLMNFVWTDYADMLTTGLFLVAMILMTQRKIEHWLIWIIADLISIPLYFYKGLLFTALQYFIFTLVAVMGLKTWRQTLKKQTKSIIL